MSYEKETLQTVINARNQAQTARENIGVNSTPDDKSLKELAAAETTLKGSLGNIFALAENYPQLRASENMQQLQEELTSTENKVSFSRQGYNDSVMLYNTKQQEFPAVLIAKMFGHNEAALFEVSEKEAKAAPKVNFS